MEKFTVEDFIKFVQIVNCMSYDRFKQMYKDVFDFVSDGYVKEKFNLMCSGFERWLCSIDYSNLELMMKICLNKRG